MGSIVYFLGEAGWARTFIDELKPILQVIFLVVGSVGAIYSFYLGFMIAKAENESKRKEAKSRIIKTLFGVFIIIFLFAMLFNDDFLDAIFGSTVDREDHEYEEEPDPNEGLYFSSGDWGVWKLSIDVGEQGCLNVSLLNPDALSFN